MYVNWINNFSLFCEVSKWINYVWLGLALCLLLFIKSLEVFNDFARNTLYVKVSKVSYTLLSQKKKKLHFIKKKNKSMFGASVLIACMT